MYVLFNEENGVFSVSEGIKLVHEVLCIVLERLVPDTVKPNPDL